MGIPLITLDTPLKFTAPGGKAHMGRGSWHLPQGDQPGEWMPDYKSTPILCERGYHWCEARHAIDWLNAECWLIEPRGITVCGDNKNVSQGGRLLRQVETWNERTTRLFAADCAEAVVHLCGDDPRPHQAIEVARLYANGAATDSELDAAGDAAWAAAGAVDRAAAGAAARDAAWDAAWAAAWDAAWAAAGAAAGAAAWDAAWAAQENRFANLVDEKFKLLGVKT